MSVRDSGRNGRTRVDQLGDLPEGAVRDTVVDDDSEELDELEREALNAAIARSVRESALGLTASAEEIIKKLRNRRSG